MIQQKEPYSFVGQKRIIYIVMDISSIHAQMLVRVRKNILNKY